VFGGELRYGILVRKPEGKRSVEELDVGMWLAL
jgi:hypothetical protein